MEEAQARETAHRILEEFEDLLTKKGVWVPSDDRTGDPDEARLFGTEYSRLEESIVELLMIDESATPPIPLRSGQTKNAARHAM